MVHRMSKRQIQLSRRAPRTAPPSARNKVPARQRGTAITASKLCVAVDVDEVLGQFLPQLCRYCADEHDMVHTIDEFFIYEFAKIWNCDQERSAYLVHEFFTSPYFLDGIPAMPGAVEVLQRLKPHTDLVVVTSRQNVIKDITRDWVHTNFPNTFSEVHFGNHWAKSGTSRSKSDMCLDVGADILIDDNPRYAYECACKGMHVLLYNWNNQYPWALQLPELQHENITVVTGWDEIEEFCNHHSASSSVDLNYMSL